MTAAERRLWYRLRAHRFAGRKFKRQVPIGSYVVDFACRQNIDPERLRTQLSSIMDQRFVPARIRAVEALPINLAGKVDCARLRAMFAAAG